MGGNRISRVARLLGGLAPDRTQRRVLAAVMAGGFGLAGISAATTGSPDRPSTPMVADSLAGAPGQSDAAPPAWVPPLVDATTTSCYGPRWGTWHAGIDFARPENAPVHAVGAGTVFGTGWLYTGYGISVVIDHGNGELTHYAHLNAVTVAVGQRVDAGELIGYEGSTGDSTGPHLHFEVHQGMWNQIDPGSWLARRGIQTGC